MVSRRVNRAVALSNENIASFVGIEDTDDAVVVLARTLRERIASGEAIGIETGSWYLTVQAWKALSRALSNELVDWGGLIERSRTIKTPAQLGYMREAARAAVAGLDEAVRRIAPGRTENDLAAAMLHGATAAGSEYTRVPLVVAGQATGVCFTTWQRRPIRSGDVVFLEAAANINGITRLSPAPALPERRRLSTGALPTSSSSPSTARSMPSVPASPPARSMPRAARVFEKAGFGDYFDHRTAYAIGIGFPPNWAEGRFLSLRPGDPTVLEPGMTFHVVPSLFMPEYGFCFSESVAVTDAGCEVLTDYPRRLIEVRGLRWQEPGAIRWPLS